MQKLLKLPEWSSPMLNDIDLQSGYLNRTTENLAEIPSKVISTLHREEGHTKKDSMQNSSNTKTHLTIVAVVTRNWQGACDLSCQANCDQGIVL